MSAAGPQGRGPACLLNLAGSCPAPGGGPGASAPLSACRIPGPGEPGQGWRRQSSCRPSAWLARHQDYQSSRAALGLPSELARRPRGPQARPALTLMSATWHPASPPTGKVPKQSKPCECPAGWAEGGPQQSFPPNLTGAATARLCEAYPWNQVPSRVPQTAMVVLPARWGSGAAPRSTCRCRAPRMLLPGALLPRGWVQQLLGGLPGCRAPSWAFHELRFPGATQN